MAHKRVLRSGEVVPFPEPFRGPWLSSVAVKLFLDGAIAARTAAMSDPYEGEEGERGLLLWPQPELERLVAEIHRAGLVASIHAIGDAAIASAVAAFEAAAAVAPIAARDRIEHCGLPLGDLPARVAACGAVPVLQTPFVRFHGDVYLRRVGPSRGERLYPARTLLAHCPVVAGSSDAPVVPDARPLTGISAAITRRSASGTPVAASEAISFEQALWLYTLGAAAAAGEDARKGSIAPGKLADLTILGADVEAVAPEELDKVPVAAVMVDGRLIVLR
jgi:predicted amidohydrolase YtcJ